MKNIKTKQKVKEILVSEFRTFKMQKRDENLFLGCLDYSVIYKIGKDAYNQIRMELQKEKIDGVIINGMAGTVAYGDSFIPFLITNLTCKEKKQINREIASLMVIKRSYF